jgi:hypothetical protein
MKVNFRQEQFNSPTALWIYMNILNSVKLIHRLPCLYTGILPAGPVTFPKKLDCELTFQTEMEEKWKNNWQSLYVSTPSGFDKLHLNVLCI